MTGKQILERSLHVVVLLACGTLISFCGCQDSSGPAGGNSGASNGSAGSDTDPTTDPDRSAKSVDQENTNNKDTNSQWKLVWSDEFDSDKLDMGKWKYETGASGWGNNEWQNYTAGGNVEVSDGTLRIIARKTGPGQKVGDYTSSRINSKFDFTYGRVEVRARMPEIKGNGLWPAIWTLGRNLHTGAGWPGCGELDIVEYLSFKPGIVQSAIHSKANNHIDKTQVESGPKELKGCEEEFHVYGMVWTETRIEFFVDDPSNVNLTFDRPKEFNADNWPFDKPQYLLLNLAVGGWGGTQGVDDSIFPAELEIDYVRIYQARQN